MKIVDALQDFSPFDTRTPGALYDYWVEYIQGYPALASLLAQNSADQSVDLEALMENVFKPSFSKIRTLAAVHARCLEILKAIEPILGEFLQDEFYVVLYWGNGSGAGWYTRYQGKPAILLGFENILILDWTSNESLRALVAHEYGHLLHEAWRGSAIVDDSRDPLHAYDILYSEGFAHYMESRVLGCDFFPELEEGNDKLSVYVRHNISAIAKEYLERAEKAAPVKDFFGSWYRWNGYRQVGYFLGYLVVLKLAETMGEQDLARISRDDYVARIGEILKSAAEPGFIRG